MPVAGEVGEVRGLPQLSKGTKQKNTSEGRAWFPERKPLFGQANHLAVPSEVLSWPFAPRRWHGWRGAANLMPHMVSLASVRSALTRCSVVLNVLSASPTSSSAPSLKCKQCTHVKFVFDIHGRTDVQACVSNQPEPPWIAHDQSACLITCMPSCGCAVRPFRKDPDGGRRDRSSRTRAKVPAFDS